MRKFNLFRKKFKIFPSHFEAVSQSLFCHCERPKGAWQSQSITSRLLRRFTPRNDITTQPFSKEESIAPPFDKGRLGGILLNSRGLSVLFLVIAMMLMVSIGYVLSYLIPTKQKSVSLVINSNQSFSLAQSGVEFAVRYATDQGWTTASQLNDLDSITRNLGQGRFTLDYNDANDSLTSVGEVPNASQRRIVVSNFTQFLQKQLVLVAGSPCWISGFINQRVRFDIRNEGPSDITIRSFEATWTHTGIPTTRLREIHMDGIQRFSGNYGSGGAPTNLNSSQTIAPSQVIRVEARWQHNRVAGNITFIFYDGANGTGESYTIDVGTPLSTCP